MMRSEPRYALALVCTLEIDGKTVSGQTRNVSRSGISLMIDQPVAVSSTAQLSLALSFGDDCLSEPLELAATIVWCTRLGASFQIGAKFIRLTHEHSEFLEMFINYLEAGMMAAERSAITSTKRA